MTTLKLCNYTPSPFRIRHHSILLPERSTKSLSVSEHTVRSACASKESTKTGDIHAFVGTGGIGWYGQCRHRRRTGDSWCLHWRFRDSGNALNIGFEHYFETPVLYWTSKKDVDTLEFDDHAVICPQITRSAAVGALLQIPWQWARAATKARRISGRRVFASFITWDNVKECRTKKWKCSKAENSSKNSDAWSLRYGRRYIGTFGYLYLKCPTQNVFAEIMLCANKENHYWAL